jgi:hypothetical protein
MIPRRPDEAMPQIERAVAINPLDVAIRVWYAAALIFDRRDDEALAQTNEVPPHTARPLH